MAEITTFPLVRYLRAEPTAHVLHDRRGELARDAAGLAFWFRPIHTAEVEKALRQPTREAIQQQADEATFARRALAVEKERAIGENELQNRIELARREEQLVEQAAANQAVEAQATDERARLAVKREADTIDLVEAARLRAERERAEIQSAMPPEVLLALALRELAGGLDELTVTPDLVAPPTSRPGGRWSSTARWRPRGSTTARSCSRSTRSSSATPPTSPRATRCASGSGPSASPPPA
jgi:hypothetical protein